MNAIDYDRIGMIKYENFYNKLGKVERIEYEWEGPPELLVDWVFMEQVGATIDQKTIKIGPYRLLFLETDPWRRRSHYIRKDYPFWWWRVFLHRISRPLDIACHRFIITLAVWGLADYHEAIAPSWRDIYLVQKIRNLRKGKA